MTFCSLHALASFMYYYSTHARINVIYLFYATISLVFLLFFSLTVAKRLFLSYSSTFRAKITSKFSSHQSGINSVMFSSIFFVKVSINGKNIQLKYRKSRVLFLCDVKRDLYSNHARSRTKRIASFEPNELLHSYELLYNCFYPYYSRSLS